MCCPPWLQTGARPMIITAIEKQRRGRRVNIYLDGHFALSLSLAVLGQAGLYQGMALDEKAVAELRQADLRQRANEAAWRLLSYRPRSQNEMRRQLQRRGLPPELIEETMNKLIQQGLLNDEEFARYWVESRGVAGKRGRRLLSHELLTKGVDRETIQQELATLSEEEVAMEAAQRRLPGLASLDYTNFRRRLSDFLLRRGFSYEIAKQVVERCWQERSSLPQEDARKGIDSADSS